MTIMVLNPGMPTSTHSIGILPYHLEEIGMTRIIIEGLIKQLLEKEVFHLRDLVLTHVIQTREISTDHVLQWVG